MPEFLFPDVDRVVYSKAPLVEVICQVRFPADLRIETTPPSDFQQRVRDSFPVLTQRHRTGLAPVPPELAQAVAALMPPTGGSTIWEFNTEDGRHTLQLLKDNLTLISRDYRRWEDFSEMFSGPYSALRDLYAPRFLTRVGLRYRDMIQRSKLGLENTGWTTLLKSHVLAEIAQNGFEARTEEAVRNLLVKLPEGGAKVRLKHGFAEIEGSSEQVYLIDCDFFVERTEVTNATSALDYFHGNARRFFRWCVSDSLHTAMGPNPIPN